MSSSNAEHSQQPISDGAQQVSRRSKDIAIDQVRTAGAIGTEAVLSGTYFYPLEGILYLFRHPRLWKPLAKPILFSLIFACFVTAFMFAFTYLPQVAILAFTNGPLAFGLAIPLVLGESSALVLFFARPLWLAPAQDDLFDEILLQQGLTSLVAQGREVEGHGRGKKLGRAIMAPLNRFSKEGIIRYLLSLPLNAIPIVGTVFFLFYNGNKGGPGHHARYFQLKKFSDDTKKKWIKERRGSYTAFGTAVMALNLIPGLSILFALTSTAGAALWACDMEKKLGTTVDVTASQEATQDVSDVGKRAE